MRCPYCNHEELKVTDSRNAIDVNAIRRRRECLKCLRRFTTFETVDVTIQVRKRDGTYEDFEQEKLICGLEAACRHSRVSHDQVRQIAYEIGKELSDRHLRAIDSQELGEIVMGHLQKADVVAYIRFACVYRRFKDINELMEAIRVITPKDAAYHLKEEEPYAAEES